MAKTYTQLDVNTNSFYDWLVLTNDMASDYATVLTVAANTVGDVTTGNGFVNGIFGANTLVLTNVRGGSVDTAGPMGVTSNVVFSGAQINATSNLFWSASNTYVVSNNFVVGSNSTINAVSVRANSTVTNIVVQGTTLNVVSNSTFSAAVTVNGLTTISNSASISGDLTVSSQLVIGSNTASLSGTTAQLVDSFSGTTYRGGKYVISLKDDANSTYQMSELLVMHDGSTAYTTEYAVIRSVANNLAVVSSNVSGTTVRLYVAPTVATMSVKLTKTLSLV